ncbi:MULTISPECIES: GrpB family protein [Actinomycetes]|uniref:GrpB family protein n=1 Tax=Actinomycetes TaxID=1760 RepID=UPI0006907584|nr:MULTISPECIES: GrpB family protein [Actinomycetes]
MAFELIGGIEKRAIVLVPYDDAWPQAFERERRRIAVALGEVAIRIDHIGSTSIPGLVAKPVIDIDLSVSDPDDEASYLPALESAGYRLRVREPGHRMVRTANLDVHVHICRSGSDWERRHLLFRDWLRHDARDREAYGELKKCLTQRDWHDMNAYASAKGPLIQEVTARAEKWAEHGGWRGLEEP